MRKIVVSIVWVCLVLIATRNAFAQTGAGKVGGLVQDVSKAVVPGVTITLTNTETGVVDTRLSNESGAYDFASVPSGIYKITAELPGFRPAIFNSVQVGTNAQVRQDVTMQVGGAGEKVEVSVSSDVLLRESAASIGEVLPEYRIRELPLVGNNVLDLLEVLPGFRPSAFGAQFDTIAGLGLNSINATINGLSTPNTRYDAQSYGYSVFTPTVINPDLVSEIRLILSPVDAELGRGNAQVQIQLRGGTNKYTGSVVWNIQNSALNANTWTNNHTGTVDSNGVFIPNNSGWRNTHQITASYGGPIIKNKTFFFGLWDQQITNTREPINVNVMTDSARQGIYRYFTGYNPANASFVPAPRGTAAANNAVFASVDINGKPVAPGWNPDGTDWSGTLNCFSVFGNVKVDGSPFTSADCPGGTAVISATPWDSNRPVADRSGYMQKILALMPRANYFASGDGLNQAQYRYIRGRTGSNTANAIVGAVLTTAGPNADYTNRKQINIRIDENLNSRHRFGGSWQYQMEDSADNVTTWPGQPNGNVRRRPTVITVNATSTLSSTLVNEARFGLNYTTTNSVNAFNSPYGDNRAAALEFLLQGGKSALSGATYPVVVNPGVGNFAGGPLNVGAEIGNTSPLWSYGDTLSWSHGKHAFKFGGELRLPRTNGYNLQPFPALTMGNNGGAAGTLSPFANAANFDALLPGLLNAAPGGSGATAARTNVTNLLYTLSGSVSSVSHSYWIENASDVANGTWQDTATKGRRYREQVSSEGAFFVKDDFKVTRNLTLNLGVRYEFYNSPYLRSGLTSAAKDLGAGLFGTFRRPSDGSLFSNWGAPGNVYLTNYGNLAGPLACQSGVTQSPLLPVSTCDPAKMTAIEFVGPRSPNPDKEAIPSNGSFGPAIGFAWQVPWFGEGKTSVRGGFQITYGAAAGNGIAVDTLLGSAPGNTLTATTNVGDSNIAPILLTRALDLTDVATLVPVRPTRLPGAPVPIYGRSIPFTAYDPNYTTPYTENFTLSVTRTIRRNLTLDVRYVGTIGKKLGGSLDLNTANVYQNKELYDALVTTRAGGDAPLFDQMLAGLNLNVNGTCQGTTTVCYGTIGSVFNGRLQRGSAHLRRSATFAANLANGNFEAVAASLIALAPSVGTTGTGQGAQPLPIDPVTGLAQTGVNQRALRNGCDRIANGLRDTYSANGIIPRCFPEDYFLANPQFTTATYNANLGHTNYQSLQIQTTLRPSQGMSFQGTYTWAKNMSLVSSNYNDPWNRNADYSRAINTPPHEFRANGSFELPVGPNKLLLGNSSGFLARAVERWQVSIITIMPAGLPRTVGAPQHQYQGNGGNTAQPRPDIVGPWVTPKMKAVWNGPTDVAGTFFGNPSPYVTFRDPQCYDGSVGAADSVGYSLQSNCTLNGLALVVPAGTAGAFPIPNDATGRYALPVLQNPQPGKQGTLGAYTIHTIGRFSLDANISKKFKMSESKQLEIRIDTRNVLNHPVLSDPTGVGNNNSLVDNFGRITGKAGTPRTFQGQIRLTF